MPVSVICDNCGKLIGNFIWEEGFSAGLKDGIKHVSCRRKDAPNGMLVACSRECVMALDDKYPKNKQERKDQDDSAVDRVFGPVGAA